MENNFQDKLNNLKSHLTMIKSLKQSEAEDEYYLLLEKAKQILGDINPYMANFYLEYGTFLLEKLQKGMDILNAGAVPQGKGEQQFQQIPQVFEDQSDSQQKGANLQKIQKSELKQQRIVYEDGDIQITQENQKKHQNKEKIQQKQQKNEIKQQSQQKIVQQEQKVDDIQIAYQNFQAALNIYQTQRRKIGMGQDSLLQQQQIEKNIIIIHKKLGNLYMVDQHYTDAIQEYQAAIKLQSEKDNKQYNRKIAQSHYNIGNCLLHENKENCEKIAIIEYCQAVKILVKNLQVQEKYDTSSFELPNTNKVRVDRFAYLNKPGDSERVQQTKEVISLLLDKIQDTFDQISFRKAYEQEKIKMNQAKEQNTFKQVSKDVKVTNLGTFGNRKKTPAPQNNLDNIPKPICILNVNKNSKEQEKQTIASKIVNSTSEHIESEKPSQNPN